MANLLVILGAVMALAGWIWIVVLAFQDHILWGLGSLFIPLVAFIFVVMHWGKAWKPFVIQLLGGILIAVGGIMQNPPHS